MKPRTQITIWLAVVLVTGLTLYVLRGVLLPFVAGMAVAFLLDPLADWLEKHGLSRITATILITAGFFLLLITGVMLLLPVVETQLVAFARNLPGYIEQTREFIDSAGGGRLRELLDGRAVDGNGPMSDLFGNVLDWGGNVLQRAVSSGLALFNILSLIFLTPVVSFYFLLEWDNFVGRVDALLPRRHAATIRRLATEMNVALSGFVRGQFTVCLLLAIFYATGLTLAGLNFGLLVGLIAGLLSFIPFVGAFVGLLASMLVAVMQFWPDYLHIALIAAIFAAGQVLEGNFLTPRLVGRKVGLHPLWVIFALLAFGAIFGFLGMLLALPMAAMVGVLARFGITQYRESSLYGDMATSSPSARAGGDGRSADL